MAALLLLVIGSSLLLLRGRPGEQQNVLVTERGVPESEETVAIVPLGEQREAPREAPTDARAALPSAVARGQGQEPAPVAPAPASAVEVEGESQAASRATEADRAYEEALSAYRDRRYDEAQRRFEQVAVRGGDNAASAALYAAQSSRARSGCPTAALLFEQVHQRYPETPAGQEAAWQAAGCYRTLGDFERARHHYEALLSTPGFADRAQAALASLGDTEPSEVAERRSTAAAAKKGRPTPAAEPAPPAPHATGTR
jgi:TolA-binding protein